MTPPRRFRFKLDLRTAAGLGALLLLALLLRSWGLGWGLPHAGRFYPYHPDESVLLDAVCRVNPLWGDFTPSFYNYGSLDIFLSRLAYDFLAPFLGWGPVPRFDLPFGAWVADFAHLLLVGRWVTALLGTGTVLLAWRLGEQLFNRRTGWLAALFLAVAPLPVMLGHFMTVDVPATFFTTLALILAALALRSAEPRRAAGWILAAGFAAGLATGTKYNSFPVFFSLLAPLWVIGRGDSPVARRQAILSVVAAALAAGIGFLLATPGALLQPALFRADLMYEMARNQEGQGLIFKATRPAALHHLLVSFPVGLEWPLYFLSLAGLAFSLRRRSPSDVLLLLFALPFFLLLVPAERKFLRYVTPLVPVLVLLAARLLDEGLSGRFGRSSRFWSGWGALAAAAALASTLAHLGVISAPDPRDRAATYLRQASAPTEIVALGSDAWFYTPPLHATTGCVKRAMRYGGPPVWDNVPQGAPRPDLCPLDGYVVLAPPSVPVPAGALSLRKLEQYRPDRVVLTDYEWEDPERIRSAQPGFKSGLLDLMEALRKDYHVEREFRPRPSFLGFTWWRWGIPPHDWRYYMPTVRIYARNR